MRLVSGLAILLCAVVTSSQAAGEEAKTLLQKAVNDAVSRAEVRYAFTVHFFTEQNEDEISVTLRYDPRRPKGETWRILGENAEIPDKNVRKLVKQLEKSGAGENRLIYNGLENVIAGAELAEETEEYAVFRAPVGGDEDMPEKMREALEIFIRLDKAGGYVSQIDLRSKKSFKPSAIAKVESLTQSQHYAAPVGDGPALLTLSEGVTKGSAMFKDFTVTTRETFFDVERVGPAETPAAE